MKLSADKGTITCVLVNPAQIMGTYGSALVACLAPSAGTLRGQPKSHLLLGIGRAEQEVDTLFPLKGE